MGFGVTVRVSMRNTWTLKSHVIGHNDVNEVQTVRHSTQAEDGLEWMVLSWGEIRTLLLHMGMGGRLTRICLG